MMNAVECTEHATECDAKAAQSHDRLVCDEFLGLSAQWRSLAVRQLYLGLVEASAAPNPAETAGPPD
jgi:hypothetical protein